MRAKLAMLLAILAVLTAEATPTKPLAGTFALQGGAANAQGYLIAVPLGGGALDTRIETWMTPVGSNAPITSYDVDMTKLLHMVIVSDDFRTFLHVHPALQPGGRFVLDQKFPRATLYHVYADAEPRGIGQQVFRFDLPLGAPATVRDLSERATTVAAGPYTVRISTNALSSNGGTHLIVRILKHGKPANDLHPYLGALAHAVFLNASDLSYVHVHPLPLSASGNKLMKAMEAGAMDMDAMPALPDSTITSPNMQLHVELHEPGTYKLWLQFRGGDRLYAAPFVVTAQP
jgi:hypothetical protein